jgi:hypothetical protein
MAAATAALMPVRALGVWGAARNGDCESLASLICLGESVNRENAVRRGDRGRGHNARRHASC